MQRPEFQWPVVDAIRARIHNFLVADQEERLATKKEKMEVSRWLKSGQEQISSTKSLSSLRRRA
jgi:hypothetical protein